MGRECQADSTCVQAKAQTHRAVAWHARRWLRQRQRAAKNHPRSQSLRRPRGADSTPRAPRVSEKRRIRCCSSPPAQAVSEWRAPTELLTVPPGSQQLCAASHASASCANGTPRMHARHEIGAIRSPRCQQSHWSSVTCNNRVFSRHAQLRHMRVCQQRSHLAPAQAAEAGARRAAAPPATARPRRRLLAETPAPPQRLSSSGQQGGTPAPPVRCWGSGAAAALRACCHKARRCEHRLV